VSTPSEAPGRLRVYLGAAPGVGKTYAMLGEAHRRRARGTDVVIGLVEDHGRAATAEQVVGLEIVPRVQRQHRGVVLDEMDLEALLERRPDVVCVDELAHTNASGGRNVKRWQDVRDLLGAGIDVIATVNIQHLESLNDVVEQITGVRQQETVPDAVVRGADQIELVDMSPESLRRRLAHGNVYAAEQVDAALANYFRLGNLTALRELALLWLADRVDASLNTYRAAHGIAEQWGARERVVVALTGGPEGDTLVRRAARIASRAAGGELHAVFVARSDGLAGARPAVLSRQRELVQNLDGEFHTVVGEDVPEAILAFARSVNATQLVVGSSRRPRWSVLFGAGVGQRLIRDSGDIDVHVVTHELVGHGRRGRGLPSALSRRRTLIGWALALLAPSVMTAALAATRSMHDLATELMAYFTLAVLVALVGGRWPSFVAAVSGGLLLNYYFAPPVHTLTIDRPANALAVVVFVVVAIAVAHVVDLAARREREAARAGAEAATLALVASSVLRGEDALAAFVERLRETYAMDGVAILQREQGRWQLVAASGNPPLDPADADVEVSPEPDVALVLRGRALPAADRRVLTAFAAQAAGLLEMGRLRDAARTARREAEGNRIRTALLAAVSHDLRTPLAGVKAAVSALRHPSLALSGTDRTELLETIEQSADRLDSLVGNLLDMSRLQTDTVRPQPRVVHLDEVLPGALSGVAPDLVTIDVPDDLDPLLVDPGLLERALANIVENASHYSPPGQRVLLQAGNGQRGVEVRIVDRGPGVPTDQRAEIFAPFQRFGDVPNGTGVGLGLAVARGFTEAMGGTVEAEDTPGGGLTMVLTLPTAGGAPAAAKTVLEPPPELAAR
jgi:two-component system, OmpR family, sensor histidine kinase KdpD